MTVSPLKGPEKTQGCQENWLIGPADTWRQGLHPPASGGGKEPANTPTWGSHGPAPLPLTFHNFSLP